MAYTGVLSALLWIGLTGIFGGCQRVPSVSQGGMWPLPLLDTQRVAALRTLGLRIPITEIDGSQDDGIQAAVVQFGKGCTGSIVSSQGLIMTNYHCAYSAIQQLDNPERDIWVKGYWAKRLSDELPVSGLSITVTKRVVDITAQVLPSTTSLPLDPTEMTHRLEQIQEVYRQQYPHCNVQVRSYKHQTVFLLYVQMQYTDIRLVGVLPKSVAKFGGETDNWMWPRYCADFAYFRVYAGRDGQPVNYHPANVPLATQHHLHFSTGGYAPGDLALVMGYPLQSDRNAMSFQVWEKTHVLNPPMIQVRQQLLAILEEEMARDDRIRRIYSEKFSTLANYYKNAVGMNHWVDTLAIVDKKARYETRYMEWLKKREGAGQLSDQYKVIEAGIHQNAPYQAGLSYYSEAFDVGFDIIRFISAFDKAFENIDQKQATASESRRMLQENIPLYYKNVDIDVEKRVMKAMLRLLQQRLPAQDLPDVFANERLTDSAAIHRYVDKLLATSIFGSQERLLRWIHQPDTSLAADPAYQLYLSIQRKRRVLFKKAMDNDTKIKQAIAAFQRYDESFRGSTWYPDADGTIRVSYGQIKGLGCDTPQAAYSTQLGGLVARASITNPDFYLHPLLKSIEGQRHFGVYETDGDIPICFIAEGDVTGGNSGSPALNARGEIIGLVFDVNWESMTREFNYEADLHRVICVDIRYILLLTERFSGSRRLIQEMEGLNQGGGIGSYR